MRPHVIVTSLIGAAIMVSSVHLLGDRYGLLVGVPLCMLWGLASLWALP